MSKTRSQQVITLASLLPLNSNKSNTNSASNTSSPNKKPIIWKDFGVYLDKKIDSHLNRDSDQISSITLNSSPSSSYLSSVNKYKICNSCNRPIGIDSLSGHYNRCVEMKQKKKDLEAAAAASGSTTSAAGGQGKRKRGRNALLDVDQSSVESSRNSTPLPQTPAQSGSSAPNGTTVAADGTVKPKKKYKKSKTQREKEAANAAAAAAAAALAANNKLAASKKGDHSASNNNSDASSSSMADNLSGTSKKLRAKSQAKLKGPVDVEKQCGVPLPSGGFCARSLTCKTHSMGAKRAVLGRSAPYDVLLQQYQKRNQAKLAANNALAAQRRENAAFTRGAHGDARGDGDSELGMSNQMVNKVLDPDEETHLVLEGLSKNHPAPLERKVIMPVRNRHRFLYMREAYANALITSSVNSSSSSSGSGSDQTLANQAISGSIGGLQGRCTLVNVDQSLAYVESDPNVPYSTQAQASISGELYQVRAPSKAILLTSQYNNMQQQAFQQQLVKHQQQMLLLKQRQQQQAQQAAQAHQSGQSVNPPQQQAVQR